MSGRHILLVEDDADHRASLADILRQGGHRVTEADSAEAALEQLQIEHVDLLITDYRLGGATGTWLARLATRFAHPTPPRVLLVSAYRELSDADGFEVLRKPFGADAFLAKVEQTLAAPPRGDAEQAARPAQRIALTLYVSDSMLSLRAAKNLRMVLARYRDEQVALTVINLSHDVDHHAEEDRIVVTPTLLRTFPAPRVWLVGNLDKRDLVERLLSHAGVDRLGQAAS